MLFNFIANEDAYDRLIRENATEQLTDKQFIEREIRRFKISIKRHEMYCGENYYKGKQDILRRKRTAIGEGGKLESVDNLPNNRIVDNQYQKMVAILHHHHAADPAHPGDGCCHPAVCRR